MDDHGQSKPSDPSRREFLLTMGSSAAATVLSGCATSGHDESRAEIADRPSPQTSVCTARHADQRIFSNFGRRNLATPHRNLFRWPQIRSSGVIVRCHECFEPFFVLRKDTAPVVAYL